MKQFLSALFILMIFDGISIAREKNISLNRMDGIALDDYKGFEKKWKLITVRYRPDTQELRFVYANEKARKAMEKGMREFPDGSVFAKIAHVIERDPSFDNSLGPGAIRRYQFMVKNRKKYAANKGWGFALFNEHGEVNPDPIHEQVNACMACHLVVPERDYVFAAPAKAAETLPGTTLPLKVIPISELPMDLRQFLPSAFKEVRKIKGFLTDHVFQGTLDEMRPLLSRIAVNTRSPVLFESKRERKFLLVFPEDLSLECEHEGQKGLYVRSINSLPGGQTNKIHFCQSFH